MTAEMLISECKKAGVTVALSPEGKLRVSPPGKLSDVLRTQLKACGAEVVALLSDAVDPVAPRVIFSHSPTPARRSTAPLPWHGRMKTLTDWFLSHIHELPTAPFSLGVGIYIAEPERFYSMLRLDVESGPTGARGRSGAVEDDLVALRERWAIQHEHEAAA